MKLDNVYKSIVNDELLAEDRNQAKAILKKAGITTDGWKHNPDAPETSRFFLDKIVGLNTTLKQVHATGDYGFWTKNFLDAYQENNTQPSINRIKLIYEYCDELNLDIKKGLLDYREKNKGVTFNNSLSNFETYLNRKWVDKYIETYIPREIIDVINDEGSYNDLVYRLRDQAHNTIMRKLLVKNHRNLLRYMPIGPKGEVRNPEYITGIVRYIKNLHNDSEYGTEEKFQIVRDTSNIIWEGDGQIIIQIEEDDAHRDQNESDVNKKICHGSQEWCIIYDPENYWSDNAGDATFVLFNRDLNKPYNRIAFIYSGDGFEYWDENDNEISNHIDSVIPNREILEEIIRDEGDLLANPGAFDEDAEWEREQERERESVFENISDGEIISEYRLGDHLSDDEIIDYFEKIMSDIEKGDSFADLRDEIYNENFIPTELKDRYYKLLVEELNTLLNPSEYLGNLPEAVKAQTINIPDRYINSFKNGDKNTIEIDDINDLSLDDLKVVQDYVLDNYMEIDTAYNSAFGVIFQQYLESSDGSTETLPTDKTKLCGFINKHIFIDFHKKIGDKISTLNVATIRGIDDKCKYGIAIKLLRKYGNTIIEQGQPSHFLSSDYFPIFYGMLKSTPQDSDIFKLINDAIQIKMRSNSKVNLPDTIKKIIGV